MELPAAFDPEGVLAVVGAGGKKSTLYALAAALERAVVTATVRIPPFESRVDRLVVTDDPVDAVADNAAWPLGVAAGRDADRERYLGYDPAVVDRLAAATDVPVLVKADGARTRWVKAPAANEPQVPESASVVVPVASVKVVGEPLSRERVHRPERVAALTGREAGETVEPSDLVTVLAHEEGGMKGVPDEARVVVLLNMVDDAALEATARGVAADLLEHPRVDRVVLGRMDRGRVVDALE